MTHADGNSHPTFSNGISVDVITGSSEKAFVHDIAWDHGKNVYITVRNQTTKVGGEYLHGIYAVALDLNGVPVSTPLYTPSGEEYFNIGCTDGQYTVSLGQTGGTGTLTGAGTYDACSKVTVTVTPDNQYKFIRWTEGGVEVSKEKSYSFYLTRNRELTAEFEPAVYNNITWWNLFEKGEDITSPSLDGTRNARLWYLFMPYYNKLSGETLRGIFASHSTGEYNVMAFANTATKNLLTDEDGPLYWLGCYVRHVVVDSTTLLKTYSNYNRCLYAFVNRVGYVKNSSGYQYTNSDTYTTPSCLIDTISRFASQSDSFQWRPWWTRIACDLPSTMTYNDPLPIGWTKIDGPSGADYDTYTDELPTSTSIKLTKTPKWYKWNNVDSDQNAGTSDTHILAWRKDGVKGPIVTRIEEDDLRLYATYVKKHIHENDPEPNMSGNYPQDATNSDVFRLLFNKRWESDSYAHKLTITRKIQGGMYNTVCFPFKVYLGQDGSIPDGNQFKDATFWAYTGTSSKYNESGDPVTILEFQQVTDTLGAGIPYLVWSDNDITDEVLFGNADSQSGHTHVLCDTVPKLVAAKAGSPIPISFVGVINPEKNLPSQSLILVADSRLACTTEPGRMEGLRGYFRIDPMWASDIAEQAADGRVYLSMKKPVTTSIPVAPEAEQQTKPEVRKVMYDGNIYILRDNEVYTITGHRVK